MLLNFNTVNGERMDMKANTNGKTFKLGVDE